MALRRSVFHFRFPPSRFSSGVTLQTSSSIFSILSSIFSGKLMPMLAMSFSPLLRTTSRSTERQSTKIPMFIWAKNLLSGHSEVKSSVNSLVGNTKIFRPLHSGLTFSVKLNKAINPSVALLGCPRDPSAVSGFVVPVVINPVNGHSLRRNTHIIDKVLQTVAPAVAYCNSSTAVVFISMILGVKASLFNTKPNGLYTRAAQPMRNQLRMYLGEVRQHFFTSHFCSPCGNYNGTEWKWSQS